MHKACISCQLIATFTTQTCKHHWQPARSYNHAHTCTQTPTSTHTQAQTRAQTHTHTRKPHPLPCVEERACGSHSFQARHKVFALFMVQPQRHSDFLALLKQHARSRVFQSSDHQHTTRSRVFQPSDHQHRQMIKDAGSSDFIMSSCRLTDIRAVAHPGDGFNDALIGTCNPC
jgi:hypothetical protein